MAPRTKKPLPKIDDEVGVCLVENGPRHVRMRGRVKGVVDKDAGTLEVDVGRPSPAIVGPSAAVHEPGWYMLPPPPKAKSSSDAAGQTGGQIDESGAGSAAS